MATSRTHRVVTVSVVSLCAALYACQVVEETSVGEQAGSNLQGSNLQGSNLQGSNLQGMSLQGFLVDGAVLEGVALTGLHVEKGELVAQRGADTLRGDQ